MLNENYQYIDSMMSELHVLKTLEHKNIIGIYDLLHDGNYYYQIQELAKHGNLLNILTSM